jgi:hypothetical protein
MSKKAFKDVPERPEWQIFSKILGRDVRPPENYEEKGAPMLKDLLKEAYSTNPEALIKMTCCGKKGGGVLNSYWEKMNNDPRIVEDSMRYCMSYLWTKREDGTACKARDQERGTSGNAIEYWNPKEGGIVAYIRERVGYAIGQFCAINTIPKSNVSLDKLKEFNLELTNSGDFVRAMDSYETDDTGEEGLGDFFDEVEDSEIPKMLNGDVDVDLEAEYERPLDEIIEAAGIMQEEMRIQKQSRDFAKEIRFKSENRPDLIWMEQALGREHDPDPDFEGRMEQMRELASEVIEVHCKRMPVDDLAAIKEDLEEWNPAQDNFLHTYPDVVAEVDTQLEKENKAAHIIKYVKNTRGVDSVQTSLFGLEGSNLSASELIEQKNLWRKRSTPEALDDPSRPDFMYLRKSLGMENNRSQDTYQDARRLKAMAWCYIDQRAGENALGAGLRAGISEWDPTRSFFHEKVIETISDLSVRGKLNDKELEQATVMMNPDSPAAKKARLEMEQEAGLDKELAVLSQPAVEEIQSDLFD